MIDSILSDVIGENFHRQHLKTPRERRSRVWRELRFEGSYLTPEPFLIRSDDGRVYKLLSTGKRNSYWINLLIYNYSIASHLDFVPSLIWHDDQHILTEFIKGEIPDVRSRDFSISLGHCMAHLHKIDVGTQSRHSVIRNIKSDLAEIVETRLLAEGVAKRVHDRLSAQLPVDIRTSLTYVDLQPANFCLSAEGQLFLFDVGSFRRGRVTDDGLFGHKLARPSLARMIEFPAFKESYIEAGGMSCLFDSVNLLEALDDIRKAAQCARRYGSSLIIQTGRRRMYRRLIGERTARLVAFGEG